MAPRSKQAPEDDRGLTPEQIIARRVGRIREKENISWEELADEANRYLDEAESLTREALRDLVRGRRRIRVNEWLALSAALSTAPVFTLTPIGLPAARHLSPRLGRLYVQWRTARKGERPAWIAWLTGERMLPSLERSSIATSAKNRVSFYLEQVPDYVRRERDGWDKAFDEWARELEAERRSGKRGPVEEGEDDAS